MNDRYLLFLPATEGAPTRWLRFATTGGVMRGEGVPAPVAEDEIVAVTPAAAVALHWTALPDRSEAQALAAARVGATSASLAPAEALHVAIGGEPGTEPRPVAVVAAEAMRGWLGTLAEHGIDPKAMIPAPLLVPPPDDGFVRADLGGDVVVRGVQAGFADEPGLTPALTAGAEPVPIDQQRLEAAVLAALDAPPLDLRQGSFARRKPRAPFDWAELRRIGWLAGALVALSLAVVLVQLVRENLTASSLEARSDALAAQAMKPGETVNNADHQLDERLRGLRGPGLGFTRTAGAVFAAVRAVPGTELTAINFDAKGSLRMTVTTQGEGAANDLLHQLAALGLHVEQSGKFTSDGARVSGDFVVRPQ